jgi:hypothetical protein
MPATTEFSGTGSRYQVIVRGECGPLTEWLFGDAAIEPAMAARHLITLTRSAAPKPYPISRCGRAMPIRGLPP